MFLVGLVSWWYGSGWRGQLRRTLDGLVRTMAFFSVGQLLATLFSPYRQISASVAGGSFGQIVRGFFDQLVSRIIGAIVRLFTVLAGVIVVALQVIVGIITATVWLAIPFVPLAAIALFAIGWTPIW